MPCFSFRPVLSSLLATLLALLPVVACAQGVPRLVSSIPPLQLIAQDIMQGIAQPQLLSAQNADPHHLSLRVSERRQLADADILFWVGPGLEQPLAELSGQLDARLVTASEVPGLIELKNDQHLWLDPANGLLMGEALAAVLMQEDPANASRYQLNLQAFQAKVLETDTLLRQQLQALSGQYAVYHNAYGYFEAHFGLQHILRLTRNEGLKPAVQQLRRLQQLARAGELACLLIEPGVNREDLLSITGNTGLRLVTADPLGIDISVEENRYSALLLSTGNAFASCMKGQHDE